jgi:acyl-CoA reductase-like NAD-dependent aldehyde dehydrogenase
MELEFSMTIGGNAWPSSAAIEVVDPATGQRFASAPNATSSDVDVAVEVSAGAFARWAADSDLRADALRTAAKVIDAASEELGRLTTLEQGKPINAAIGEARATAGFFFDMAEVRPSNDLFRDDAVSMAKVTRRPLGVVAAIVPWNSALYVTAMKAAPALAAGNTIVVKPSPDAPLAALRLGEILRDVFPPGVFNVISGGENVGPWLSRHPAVRMVSFTGSIGTGKLVASAAGSGLKHVVLELGGNDAAIVLADADAESVSDALFSNSFGNAGQVCSGIKRVYVHESLHDEVVERLSLRARKTKVGPGLDPDTEMGPLTTPAQLEHVVDLVKDAIHSGARVVAGGRKIDGPGYFYLPTIVDSIDDEARLVAEEQFGPVLPVLSFHSDDEAMARANHGMYGLGGSVWTSDFDRGVALAEQFETGMGWVNSHKGADPTLPFGGSKWSGLGVERGIWGVNCFTEIHVTSGLRAKKV